MGKTYFFLTVAIYVQIIGWAVAHPAHPMTTPLKGIRYTIRDLVTVGTVGNKAPIGFQKLSIKNALKGKIIDFRGYFLVNFSLCTHWLFELTRSLYAIIARASRLLQEKSGTFKPPESYESYR